MQMCFDRTSAHPSSTVGHLTIAALGRIHALDPQWEGLRGWLTRAHVADERAKKAGGAPSSAAAADAKAAWDAAVKPPSPGCEDVDIGPWTVEVGEPPPTKPWCCLSSAEVVCPARVDKAVWLSGDTYDDAVHTKFSVPSSAWAKAHLDQLEDP